MRLHRHLVASALALAWANAAAAQTGAPAADQAVSPQPQALPEQDTAPDAGTSQTNATSTAPDIVVTGSRISRRDYTSPSPIVTTSQAAIQASGQINVEASLTQLPQFTVGQGQTSNVLGGGGVATINLRGLGDNRNLVLLDGRRLPIASGTGVVDINIIPQSLIGGVEVITGGASAVYGSDAISGVVNFKSRELSGVEIGLQQNISERGDAAVFEGSLSAGSRFADGRGRVFVTGTYTDRDVLLGRERTFFARGTPSGFVGTGAVLLPGVAPSQASVDAVFAKYGIAAGTVSRTSNFGFNDDGTLYAIAGGYNFRGNTSRYGVVNGQLNQFTVQDNYIIAPQKRYNLFGKTSFEIAPDIELYAQGLYSRSKVQNATGYPITIPVQPTIPLTNPFIPADLRTLLATRPPGVPTVLFKRFEETGRRVYTFDLETYQGLGGARGKFGGGGDWTWDVYYSHDRTRNKDHLSNAVIFPRVQRLLNAADGGNSICAGGYNPFSTAGSAAISPACLDYISAPVTTVTSVTQDIVEGNVQGSLFRLPAGDVKLAVTAGYRRNRFVQSPDILVIPNFNYAGTQYADLAGTLYANNPTFGVPAVSPSRGTISVKEIAGELLVPLLENSPFARSLNLTLGGRYSDYNLAGGAFTYKAEADWRPFQALLLRGGFEHAIRAPNVAELFADSTAVAAIGNTPSGGDPCDTRASARTGANGARVLALCQAQFVAAGLSAAQASAILATYTYPTNAVGSRVTGNRTLSPEKADTFTVGAVLSPTIPGLNRFSLSTDYYHINVNDAISVVSGATALAKCFNLDGSNTAYDPTNIFCSTIGRSNGTGLLFDIGAPYRNLGGFRTSGLDIQFDTEVGLGGKVRLGLNSVFNYLIDYRVQQFQGSVSQDFANTVSIPGNAIPPLPRWKGLTTLTLSLDQASLGVRWRYVAKMRDVSSVTSTTPAAGVPAYNLFDLFARLPVNDRFELRGGVNNLFDKNPLVVGGIAGQTNAGLYDIIGRSFFVGVKAKL